MALVKWSFEMGVKDLNIVLHMKDLRYHLNKKSRSFVTGIWDPVKAFMANIELNIHEASLSGIHFFIQYFFSFYF